MREGQEIKSSDKTRIEELENLILLLKEQREHYKREMGLAIARYEDLLKSRGRKYAGRN